MTRRMQSAEPQPTVRDLLKWLHEQLTPYIPQPVQTHVIDPVKEWYIKVSKES